MQKRVSVIILRVKEFAIKMLFAIKLWPKKLVKLFLRLIALSKRVLFAIESWPEKFVKINFSVFVVLYFMVFLLGQAILASEPIKNGCLHQIVLSVISLLVIYMLRFCQNMGDKLLSISSGLVGAGQEDSLNEMTMYEHISKMKRYQKSILCILVPIIPSVKFAQKTLYLEYVPLSGSGYFAVIMGASTFYIALVAYIHLVISIVAFWKIAHNSGKCIPIQFPHDVIASPKWLNLWVDYFKTAERAFFVTGMLFTFEYVILMPPQIITFEPQMVIHSKDPIAFLSAWMVIVVLIVIAFPLIAIIIRHLFHVLVGNMRSIVNNEFDFLWKNNSNNLLSELWAFKQLSVNSMKLGSYILPGKSYLPFVATSISFILNVVKFYESILFPLLSGVQH